MPAPCDIRDEQQCRSLVERAVSEFGRIEVLVNNAVYQMYFARTQNVPAEKAVGGIAAAMLTPYPPGIPAVLTGERITEPLLRYLTSVPEWKRA
ncbi:MULTISPECIES: SDR family NAD(P)-dependent oxidoreductase [Streptomyces]|uniref:SDR family NAD(P)-dependent oxidoreductase n=1 Tax=Streptomyces TaxID=1883 RepID=UPI0036772E25